MIRAQPWRKFASLVSRWRRADRLQVGALPYRLGADGVEVLLITSRGTGHWIVPKGGLMAGLTNAQAAAEEAWEEAGVRGVIGEAEAGRFTHAKTQTGRPPLSCRILLYHLRVEEELEDWPEKGQRRRQWFGAAEAAATVRSKELAALILRLAAEHHREAATVS